MCLGCIRSTRLESTRAVVTSHICFFLFSGDGRLGMVMRSEVLVVRIFFIWQHWESRSGAAGQRKCTHAGIRAEAQARMLDVPAGANEEARNSGRSNK